MDTSEIVAVKIVSLIWFLVSFPFIEVAFYFGFEYVSLALFLLIFRAKYCFWWQINLLLGIGCTKLHAVKKLELDKKVLIGKTNVLVGFVRLLILEELWIWSNIALLVIYFIFLGCRRTARRSIPNCFLRPRCIIIFKEEVSRKEAESLCWNYHKLFSWVMLL